MIRGALAMLTGFLVGAIGGLLVVTYVRAPAVCVYTLEEYVTAEEAAAMLAPSRWILIYSWERRCWAPHKSEGWAIGSKARVREVIQ